MYVVLSLWYMEMYGVARFLKSERLDVEQMFRYK